MSSVAIIVNDDRGDLRSLPQNYGHYRPTRMKTASLAPYQYQRIRLRSSSFRQTTSSYDTPIEQRTKIPPSYAVSRAYLREVDDSKDLENGSAVEEVERSLQSQQHRLDGRIFHNLMNRKDSLRQADLCNIFTAADNIFFGGRLRGRVDWRWSQPHEAHYDEELLGTTTLMHSRRAPSRTVIVLSRPIIRSHNYNRNLLLSVFLHELVHCYLLLRFGRGALDCGGHGASFHRIAALINAWARNAGLRIGDAKAHLHLFQRSTEHREDAYVDDGDDEPSLAHSPHRLSFDLDRRPVQSATEAQCITGELYSSPSSPSYTNEWQSSAIDPSYSVPSRQPCNFYHDSQSHW